MRDLTLSTVLAIGLSCSASHVSAADEQPPIDLSSLLFTCQRIPFGDKDTALAHKLLRPLWDYADDQLRNTEVFGPYMLKAEVSPEDFKNHTVRLKAGRLQDDLNTQIIELLEPEWNEQSPLPTSISGWKWRISLGDTILFEREKKTYLFGSNKMMLGISVLRPNGEDGRSKISVVHVITNAEFKDPKPVDCGIKSFIKSSALSPAHEGQLVETGSDQSASMHRLFKSFTKTGNFHGVIGDPAAAKLAHSKAQEIAKQMAASDLEDTQM